MRMVCAWCKRLEINGRAVGEPLAGEAYNHASHGICEECFDAFEQKTVASDVARRERARSNDTTINPGLATGTLRLVGK